MTLPDPNREALEIVAERLEPRLKDFLFVGGAATGLLLTDPAARRPRASKDVDVVVRLATRASYALELRPFLLQRGFKEDTGEGAPICRWIVRDVPVDIMPDDESILGFSNRWYRQAFASSESRRIAGRRIALASAPDFLAMKLEAFLDRGEGDYYGSDDMEDILTIVDGRPELVEEIAAAAPVVRKFIRDSCDDLLADDEFQNALPGHLDPGRDTIVQDRLHQIARLDHTE